LAQMTNTNVSKKKLSNAHRLLSPPAGKLIPG
jgi:hypothetical protein